MGVSECAESDAIHARGAGRHYRAQSRKPYFGVGAAAEKEPFEVHRFPSLSWRWKVDQVYTGADPQKKSGDDYPARIYVIFEYDSAEAGLATRMKYRLAKARHGKSPPLAARNDVWASTDAATLFYFSPYSDRSTMVPLQIGPAGIGCGVGEQVNIVEDYRRIFGEEPPARASQAIMNDSDNTGSSAVSYIDDIEVRKPDEKK